jgi:hypothetical protein
MSDLFWLSFRVTFVLSLFFRIVKYYADKERDIRREQLLAELVENKAHLRVVKSEEKESA